jgi:ribosomal protein S18 acetylase RimI-like enzyme
MIDFNLKEMEIEKASINDNEILTEITKKSKTYWGYSEEQILKWNDNLTISKEYIENNSAYKLVNNGKIIGYYSYIVKEEKNVILDNLFILPEYIGKGFGKYLMSDFLNRMKKEKFEKITLDSEPNAENFYLKIGFKKIGEFETSIKNRFMPIMEMSL